jgi:hypothetical protein
MEKAKTRFPFQTPPTKEAYYFRSIFESHYPSQTCATTVPQAKSIACSTEKAMEWDEKFRMNADESGRAVLGIHSTKGTNLELKTRRISSTNVDVLSTVDMSNVNLSNITTSKGK